MARYGDPARTICDLARRSATGKLPTNIDIYALPRRVVNPPTERLETLVRSLRKAPPRRIYRHSSWKRPRFRYRFAVTLANASSDF